MPEYIFYKITSVNTKAWSSSKPRPHSTRLSTKSGQLDSGSFLIFVIIIFGLYVFIKLNSSGRGRRGENFVSGKLNRLDPSRYKILNDIMLPSRGNSTSTQIDQIVISNYGIFCIETKSLKGWIFGNANQEYWTQVIFRYKGRFYNPLRQNYAHTKAIEELLGSYRLKKTIVSLVVFTRADKLKISGTNSVVYARDIVRKIESYTLPVVSNAERDLIYNLLTDSNILDRETRKLHVSEVRALKKY